MTEECIHNHRWWHVNRHIGIVALLISVIAGIYCWYERRYPVGPMMGAPALIELADYPDQAKLEAARKLLARGANPNVKDSIGWTPLMFACDWASKEFVQLLLDYGADVNETECNGNTPLHFVVGNPRYGAEEGREIVELLLLHGANINAENRCGSTPLTYVKESDTNLIKMLINHGAKRNNHRKSLLSKIKFWH